MVKNVLLPFVAALWLVGCATAPRPQPLSLVDIISMSKVGLADAEIISRIDATRTVVRLTSEQVLLLRKEGVSEGVVNYLLDTYPRYELARAREYYRSRYSYSIGFGYWHHSHHYRRGRH